MSEKLCECDNCVLAGNVMNDALRYSYMLGDHADKIKEFKSSIDEDCSVIFKHFMSHKSHNLNDCVTYFLNNYYLRIYIELTPFTAIHSGIGYISLCYLMKLIIEDGAFFPEENACLVNGRMAKFVQGFKRQFDNSSTAPGFYDFEFFIEWLRKEQGIEDFTVLPVYDFVPARLTFGLRDKATGDRV